jgi:hypothetical protein
MTVVFICEQCTCQIIGEWKQTERGRVHADSVECARLKQLAGNIFVEAATNLGHTLAEKNAAYGSSYAKCGKFLELLYPDGVKPDQYSDMLLLVRIFDKQMRIATNKDALGEDPFSDIAGYGLLGVVKNA